MIDLCNKGSWEPDLPELFLSQLGLRVEILDIKTIETGMMNYVIRIQTSKGIFFLKQARTKAKAGNALGPALQTISVQRLEFEKKCISEIRAILPDGIEIPTVHHYDPESHLLILSDVAGNDGKLLETNLQAGLFEGSTATAIGQFLGAMHRFTWGTRSSVRGSRQNDKNNWERFLRMRTIDASDERLPLAVQQELAHLCESTHQHHSNNVLIWMDCCPKNVIVRTNDKIGVIDFELASWIGDPAYDLGFFIGHYLIHALQQNRLAKVLPIIVSSIQAYCGEVRKMPFCTGIVSRVLKFAAATMIYRAIGASRLNYIQANSAPKLIQKAGVLLCQKFEGGPDEIHSHIEAAWT